MTRAERDAAKARCDKMAPGPRYATVDPQCHHRDKAVWTISANPAEAGWETDGGYMDYGLPAADAEFYAAARTDLPAALAELDRMEALLRANGIDPEAR